MPASADDGGLGMFCIIHGAEGAAAMLGGMQLPAGSRLRVSERTAVRVSGCERGDIQRSPRVKASKNRGGGVESRISPPINHGYDVFAAPLALSLA